MSLASMVVMAILGSLLVDRSIRRIRARDRSLPGRLLFTAIAFVAFAVAAGNITQIVKRLTSKPRGQILTVNGHRMRIDCTGTGSPTLILDAGLGNDGTIWSGVQPSLSKTTRVCSYDRAGFGSSDPLPPPRDADHIAAELHALLAAAHITGPIVLMGHSIAGVYIRDYATHYPEDVAGLIFVDSSTPWQDRIFPGEDPRTPRNSLKLSLERLAPYAGFPRIGAVAEEMQSFDQSGTEIIHAAPYGTLPILILSRDTRADDTWNHMQEDLLKLSTRSRRIVAQGSGHYVMLNRPEVVEREVPLFLAQIRGTAVEPAVYGSTTVE